MPNAHRPELTEATVKREPTGMFSLTVAGMPIGVQPNVAKAVSNLCAYAVQNRMLLAVAIVQGSGRRFLTIEPNGKATPSAAPAPSTMPTQHSKRKPATTAAGNAHELENTRQFVEDFLLAPPTD